MIHALRLTARLLVGAVFIFSGFVKGIDPLGSTYKFIDYFNAFGIGFLEGVALPLAILLSSAEFILGMALFLNIRMKEASWAVLVFSAFFLLLTFYIALTNPVTDCGCFGDALIMTNWQTFFKNVVLLLLVIFIFSQRHRYQSGLKPGTEWAILVLFTAFSVLLSRYSYQHLPLLDFRPYKVGTYIPEKMVIPEDAPQPEYKIILRYKKNGEVKEFDVDSIPDSTWTWVETQNILVREGYVPPIHDFTIDPLDGSGDIAGRILEEASYVFLLISYDINRYDREHHQRITELAAFCRERDYPFLVLTASPDSDIRRFKSETGSEFAFYNTDEITLKTIVRSNPGLVLLKNGTVTGKWHHNDIPSVETVDSKVLSYVLTQFRKTNEKKLVLLFLAVFFLLISSFQLVRKRL